MFVSAMTNIGEMFVFSSWGDGDTEIKGLAV